MFSYKRHLLATPIKYLCSSSCDGYSRVQSALGSKENEYKWPQTVGDVSKHDEISQPRRTTHRRSSSPGRYCRSKCRPGQGSAHVVLPWMFGIVKYHLGALLKHQEISAIAPSDHVDRRTYAWMQSVTTLDSPSAIHTRDTSADDDCVHMIACTAILEGLTMLGVGRHHCGHFCDGAELSCQ